MTTDRHLQEFQYGKETVQTNESNILLAPTNMETGAFKHLGYGNIVWQGYRDKLNMLNNPLIEGFGCLRCIL